MSIEDAVKRQILDAELADHLHADSGLRDITGSPLTVLEALKRGLIDPSSGKVLPIYNQLCVDGAQYIHLSV